MHVPFAVTEEGKTLNRMNSIAFRLSASIAIVVMATALTIAALILNDEQKTLEDRLHIRAMQLGEIMARQMIEPLLYEERYTIYTLFESYIKTNDSVIEYAEAYDENGHFLLHFEGRTKAEKLTAELSSFSDKAGFLGRTSAYSTGDVFELIYPVKTPQLGVIGYLRMGITPTQLLETLANIKRKVFTLTIFIVFFGILAGLLMARKIIKPILVLNRAVLQVEGTNLGTEIKPVGIGEIRELAISFNKMSKKLKDSMESIKKAQESLIRKEKFYVLGEFSASLAHEIKNPLTPIKMLIQRAYEQQEPLEKADFDVINSELERIDKTVDQFLGYTRITKQYLEITDLNLLVKDVIILTQHKIKKSNIKLDFLQNPAPLMVNINPDSIRQVIINLILNAIHAMPDGGILNITSRATKNDVILEIEDSGIGMTEEQMQRAFDPFFTTKPEGTGLGLSIVWNIIESHHGTITFSSKPQQGTRVKMRLPYA